MRADQFSGLAQGFVQLAAIPDLSARVAEIVRTAPASPSAQ
jgi:hypothetical protein